MISQTGGTNLRDGGENILFGKNVRNWTKRGARPWYPLDSPMQCCSCNCFVNTYIHTNGTSLLAIKNKAVNRVFPEFNVIN